MANGPSAAVQNPLKCDRMQRNGPSIHGPVTLTQKYHGVVAADIKGKFWMLMTLEKATTLSLALTFCGAACYRRKIPEDPGSSTIVGPTRGIKTSTLNPKPTGWGLKCLSTFGFGFGGTSAQELGSQDGQGVLARMGLPAEMFPFGLGTGDVSVLRTRGTGLWRIYGRGQKVGRLACLL